MLDEYRTQFLDLFSRMIEIPAVNPSGGGKGEEARAAFLKKEIMKFGNLKMEEYIADSSGIKRPNLLFLLDGKQKKTFWFVAHMDTVSEGDISLWKYPPFKATIEGDRVYGRGSCDNGQGVISSLITLKYFIDHPEEMKNNVGVILVSDEEAGSKYGIDFVIKNRKFDRNDNFVVPDFGTPDGSEVEVAEKGLFWLKVTVIGKQCHASTPELGKNAHRLGRVLEERLDADLHRKFNHQDTVFSVPFSTFEPTKVEPGTSSINIIPGKEAFYFDMRIIPEYRTDEVFAEIKQVVSQFQKEFGVDVLLEPVQKEEATYNTKEGENLTEKFIDIVERRRKLKVRKVGIGGGTCGAFFRREGYDTIIWGTLDEVEHMPNEYAKISNIFGDAEVFIDLVKSSTT
jgi:succinyl-diaminopimelate desuccinylase